MTLKRCDPGTHAATCYFGMTWEMAILVSHPHWRQASHEEVRYERDCLRDRKVGIEHTVLAKSLNVIRHRPRSDTARSSPQVLTIQLQHSVKWSTTRQWKQQYMI